MLTCNKRHECLAVPAVERGVERHEACIFSSHGALFFYLERDQLVDILSLYVKDFTGRVGEAPLI